MLSRVGRGHLKVESFEGVVTYRWNYIQVLRSHQMCLILADGAAECRYGVCPIKEAIQ